MMSTTFNKKTLFIILTIFIIVIIISFSTFEITEKERYNINNFRNNSKRNNSSGGYNNIDFNYKFRNNNNNNNDNLKDIDKIVFGKLKNLQELFKSEILNFNEFNERKNQVLDLYINDGVKVEYRHNSEISTDSNSGDSGGGGAGDNSKQDNKNELECTNIKVEECPIGFNCQKKIEYIEQEIFNGTMINKTIVVIPKPKNIVIDILVPFPQSRLDHMINGLKEWSIPHKVPCDKLTVGDYFPGAESNLVFYQNFDMVKDYETKILQSINETNWRKCFKDIKFVYASNTPSEDQYPYGISSMFYKYFSVGPISDYFFWIETDTHPLRKDWQIEIFRTTIYNLEARRDKPFYSMGSNVRHNIIKPGETRKSQVYHINGNALYWRDKYWYDTFLVNVQNWNKKTHFFDCDIHYYMEENENWERVKVIYQEFIFYEIIQNLGHEQYNEQVLGRDSPRTFLVHS